MKQFNLYIGADNKVGQVDKVTLVSLLNNVFLGYTIIDAIGYWQGKAEKSILVTIFTAERDRFFMLEYCRGIATVLNQDCICLQTIEANGEMSINFPARY